MHIFGNLQEHQASLPFQHVSQATVAGSEGRLLS